MTSVTTYTSSYGMEQQMPAAPRSSRQVPVEVEVRSLRVGNGGSFFTYSWKEKNPCFFGWFSLPFFFQKSEERKIRVRVAIQGWPEHGWRT